MQQYTMCTRVQRSDYLWSGGLLGVSYRRVFVIMEHILDKTFMPNICEPLLNVLMLTVPFSNWCMRSPSSPGPRVVNSLGRGSNEVDLSCLFSQSSLRSPADSGLFSSSVPVWEPALSGDGASLGPGTSNTLALLQTLILARCMSNVLINLLRSCCENSNLR